MVLTLTGLGLAAAAPATPTLGRGEMPPGRPGCVLGTLLHCTRHTCRSAAPAACSLGTTTKATTQDPSGANLGHQMIKCKQAALAQHGGVGGVPGPWDALRWAASPSRPPIRVSAEGCEGHVASPSLHRALCPAWSHRTAEGGSTGWAVGDSGVRVFEVLTSREPQRSAPPRPLLEGLQPRLPRGRQGAQVPASVFIRDLLAATAVSPP